MVVSRIKILGIFNGNKEAFLELTEYVFERELLENKKVRSFLKEFKKNIDFSHLHLEILNNLIKKKLIKIEKCSKKDILKNNDGKE